MKIALFAGLCALAGATLSASPARAQEYTRKSFLLRDGGFEITGDPARPLMAGINLSEDSVAEPIFIAPHFYWGASDDVTLGISHGTGLCLNQCDKVYNDAGFDLMLFLTGSDNFELDLHAGVPVRSFDPFWVGIQGGVIGRVNFGDTVAFVFDPSVYIGFSNRDQGNREGLDLPFWFYFQATPTVVPFVGSAFSGPLDGFFDAFAVPLEGGILFSASRNVDLGFVLRFNNLLGHGGNGDSRLAGFLGQFRF